MKYPVRFCVAAMVVCLGSTVAALQQNSAAKECGKTTPKATGAGRNHSLPEPYWNVKVTSGSLQSMLGQWLKGAFVTEESAHKFLLSANVSLNGAHQSSEQSSAIVAIPQEHVLSIYFDLAAEKDSDRLEQMSRSGCSYAKSLTPPRGDSSPQPTVFVAWTRSRGPVSRTIEHFSRRNPIKLTWKDGDTEKVLVITVNHCEYESFLENLRRFAGERWKAIGRESP